MADQGRLLFLCIHNFLSLRIPGSIIFFVWKNTNYMKVGSGRSLYWSGRDSVSEVLPCAQFFLWHYFLRSISFLIPIIPVLGTGSGSVCFWISWIQIRIRQSEVRSRILLSSSKKSQKNIDSYFFVTFLWLFIIENDVNVPSKSKQQKNFGKNSFFVGVL